MEKMSPLITQCQQQQTPVLKHPTTRGKPKGNLKPLLLPPRGHASRTMDLDTSPSARWGCGRGLQSGVRANSEEAKLASSRGQEMPAARLPEPDVITRSLIRLSPTYPSLLPVLPQALASSHAVALTAFPSGQPVWEARERGRWTWSRVGGGHWETWHAVWGSVESLLLGEVMLCG